MLTLKFKNSYTDVRIIFETFTDLISSGQQLTLKGWIQRIRKQQDITFIEFYDGSYAPQLQLVCENACVLNVEIDQLYPSSAIEVIGNVITSPSKGQPFDFVCSRINLIGKIYDPATSIACSKNIQLKSLRDKCDERTKFQSMRAIYEIRALAFEAIHEFFKLLRFKKLDPNIITTSDCEGAGEVFTITTLNPTKNANLFTEDFFGKQAYLTVSSQLQLEALCTGMSKVYTTNPSFRAEPSETNRHVACFTHVEWEIAFIVLTQLLDFNEDIIKYVIDYVLCKGMPALTLLNKFISQGIIEKLQSSISKDFIRITYTEALLIITNSRAQLTDIYPSFVLPTWGDDLGSHAERYLADVIYKHPVLVYDYPQQLKSFYMKANNEEMHVRTVQSCDCLLPGIGEVIGSSIREDSYEKLMQVLVARKMDSTSIKWYVDMRKNGTFPHGGAGLGFDRLVAYLTFMEGSIRDVIPFPVAYKQCDF